MTEQKIGEGRIALMERKRRRMLAGSVIGFALWQGLGLLSGIKSLNSTLEGALLCLSLVAWAVWCVYLVKSRRFEKEIAQDPVAWRALNDERWEQNRLKAAAVGFAAVGVAQVGLTLLWLWVSLDAMVAVQTTILVGVSAFIVAFLRYDGKE